jgi:hypothetical protein
MLSHLAYCYDVLIQSFFGVNQKYKNIGFVSIIFFLGLIAFYNLNYFLTVIHLFYFFMVLCWNHIKRIEKKDIEIFIYNYNIFQICLSGIMSAIGFYIFYQNITNPFMINNFEYDYVINKFLLLHAYSKIVDFVDTMILIVTNKPFTILHTYHHITIGLIWFLLYNTTLNSAYFGAFINSIVHTIMYSYYNYSKELIFMKQYITSIQLIQFGLCIFHSVYFMIYTEHYINYAYLQFCYHITMIILFGNFFYQNYVIKKIK